MGLLTIIRKQKAKDHEIRVLILGLDNSGKTTIVRRILKQDTNTVSPTMGFQISTANHNGFALNLWDIGGQGSLRGFWGNYYEKTQVVIWVIDCVSLERLNESYTELREKVIQQDRLVGVYLMVLINKIDLVPENEIESIKEKVTEILDLAGQIPQRDMWCVEAVSGKTGANLQNTLDWLTLRNY